MSTVKQDETNENSISKGSDPPGGTSHLKYLYYWNYYLTIITQHLIANIGLNLKQKSFSLVILFNNSLDITFKSERNVIEFPK